MLARKQGFKSKEIDRMDLGFLQDCLIAESNAIRKATLPRKDKVRKATQADYDQL